MLTGVSPLSLLRAIRAVNLNDLNLLTAKKHPTNIVAKIKSIDSKKISLSVTGKEISLNANWS
jgi:hypothetical protein